MKISSLGKSLYEGTYNQKVYHNSDGNGHLNNADYFSYCENVRNLFLEQFGWSDEKFNQNGIAQRRRSLESEFKLPLKKGDVFEVRLKVYEGKDPFFHVLFDFFNKDKNIVFRCLTNDLFVSIAMEKPIKVPNFFYDALQKTPKI
jgi:YbgC/YbaW family acyl-CoA thioester hydrolase